MAADQGMFREMLEGCPIGSRIMQMRDLLEQLPGESSRAFSNRVYRKLKQTARSWRCLDYQTCEACPVGKQIVTLRISEQGTALPAHVETLVSVLGTEGPNRSLPRVCGIGNQIRIVSSAGGDYAELAVAALEQQHGCRTQPSCLCCPAGVQVFEDALVDLRENGMAGDYGHLLRESYPYLW